MNRRGTGDPVDTDTVVLFYGRTMNDEVLDEDSRRGTLVRIVRTEPTVKRVTADGRRMFVAQDSGLCCPWNVRLSEAVLESRQINRSGSGGCSDARGRRYPQVHVNEVAGAQSLSW